MITQKSERVFTALADTTRRQLLITLAEASPRTATQLAKGFKITRQGVLKHLDVLEEAGLVHVQPKGREKRYSLTLEPLQDVNDWIKAIGATWEARLQRLKDFVESDESL